MDSAPITPPKPAGILENWFELSRNATTVRTEVLAGFSTFMTMAYILFVNPLILSGAGMPFPAVVAATCIGAAMPTLIMGIWARFPVALASGMGLNAALVMHANQPGMTWQTMMGVIVLEGIIITVLVLTGAREKVMEMIPMNLKRAIGVGIGLFIAFLGLQQMGWVMKGPGSVFATHGDFALRLPLIGAAGVLLAGILMARRVPGSLLLGILGATVIAWVSDRFYPAKEALVRFPEQWMAMPDFSVMGQADFTGALKPALIGVVFSFLITDFFDTMGTVIAVSGQGKLHDAQGRIPRLKRILLVDSFAAMWGGFCGASSVTSYIESAAGVSQGGRTGLVNVVVAALFAAALFFAPTIGLVPGIATAPVLLVVGFLMMAVIREMELTSIEQGLPAFLTLMLIPLGQSISFGIGVGFISHVLIQVLMGKGRDVSPWLYAVAGIFFVSFGWGK
ncbi:MAG TPA: NCS2 family permease [Roseimicrobium sp.]|nr:NCS2 family permease [Roseimicrobium sp.]